MQAGIQNCVWDFRIVYEEQIEMKKWYDEVEL